jgi:hypothetical protein
MTKFSRYSMVAPAVGLRVDQQILLQLAAVSVPDLRLRLLKIRACKS